MKNLKLFSIALVILAIVGITGCNRFNCQSGSGKQVSQTRTLSAFSKIKVGGSFRIILKQDSSHSVRIVADDNIQRLIETDVNGNTLNIGMEGNFCNTGQITVYLSSKNLEGIDASGAVEIESANTIKTKDFLLGLSGSTKVTLDLNASLMQTRSSGSSEIYLKGQAGTHEINISGSGEVEALDFVVGKYNIESSGASECNINVLNELHVSSSGSSDVKYKGSPQKVTNNNSGSSSVKKVN